MVSMPKKPFNWGDDLNDVQINRSPSMDAPVTVTDPDAVTGFVPSIASNQASAGTAPDGMVRGSAPAPEAYARLGELAGQMLTDPHDPTGDFQASGMMYNLGQQLAFHRGGPLDAQVRYGGSPPYANYVYGVYNAARGADLGDVLDLANLYGKLFSRYRMDDPDHPMDQIYQSIPAANVQNISKGYGDYKSGKLGR